MSVTDTHASALTATTPQNGRQTRETPPQPGPTPALEHSHAPAQAAEVPAPAPKTQPSIGFTLHYDNDTRRLILEAREPVTGFLIYQMPPKYVVRQFTASVGGIEPARGATVDSAV